MNEWINVEDRLPDHVPYGQHRFLVMCACSHMAHQAVARNFPYPCSEVNIAYWSDLNNRWSFSDLEEWDPKVYVTHWMPLPQPPEKKRISVEDPVIKAAKIAGEIMNQWNDSIIEEHIGIKETK